MNNNIQYTINAYKKRRYEQFLENVGGHVSVVRKFTRDNEEQFQLKLVISTAQRRGIFDDLLLLIVRYESNFGRHPDIKTIKDLSDRIYQRKLGQEQRRKSIILFLDTKIRKDYYLQFIDDFSAHYASYQNHGQAFKEIEILFSYLNMLDVLLPVSIVELLPYIIQLAFEFLIIENNTCIWDILQGFMYEYTDSVNKTRLFINFQMLYDFLASCNEQDFYLNLDEFYILVEMCLLSEIEVLYWGFSTCFIYIFEKSILPSNEIIYFIFSFLEKHQDKDKIHHYIESYIQKYRYIPSRLEIIRAFSK